MLDPFEFTFMPIGVDGSWRCVTSDYAGTLAEFLALHQLVVDDDCQFCRIIRYDGKYKYTYEYRAYTSMRISVKLFKTIIQ